mmetsp:Transcript_80899/g.142709  ORF Transcript_80899/g.142709 Transcript_80899/m.142709 type:complete len:296 (+) Transcript_80899:384-1271(+)
MLLVCPEARLKASLSVESVSQLRCFGHGPSAVKETLDLIPQTLGIADWACHGQVEVTTSLGKTTRCSSFLLDHRFLIFICRLHSQKHQHAPGGFLNQQMWGQTFCAVLSSHFVIWRLVVQPPINAVFSLHCLFERLPERLWLKSLHEHEELGISDDAVAIDPHLLHILVSVFVQLDELKVLRCLLLLAPAGPQDVHRQDRRIASQLLNHWHATGATIDAHDEVIGSQRPLHIPTGQSQKLTLSFSLLDFPGIFTKKRVATFLGDADFEALGPSMQNNGHPEKSFSGQQRASLFLP